MYTELLAETRERVVELKIALRNIEQELEDFVTLFTHNIDYTGLGKNEGARKIALDAALLSDQRHMQLRKSRDMAQDAVDRADVELEALFDQRRAEEQRTWALLAEYVASKRDHIGYAPAQAAREIGREEILEDITY